MRYNSEKSLCGHSFNDDILFTVEDIEYSVVCLRNGKACGTDGSSKENIVYSYPALIEHLKLLFNVCHNRRFVPDKFGINNNNNNTNICKAHIVSIRAEAEAPALALHVYYTFGKG